MKLKLTALILLTALLITSVGCIKFGPTEPTAAPTEVATEAPTEAPTVTAAPTEEPPAGVTLINESGVDLSEVYISPSYSESWGEMLGELDDGDSMVLSFDEFEGEPGEEFDIGTLDYEDMCYDCYGVTLYEGSVVRFVCEGGVYSYKATSAYGTVEFDADVYRNGEASAAEVLHVDIELCHDNEYSRLPRSYSEYMLAHLGDADSEYYPELAAAMETRAEQRREEQSDELNALMVGSQSDHGIDFKRCEYNYNAFVRRADNKVTSVLYETEYTDEHSYYYAYSADNFNTETGELLSISDVVLVSSALPSAINDVLKSIGILVQLDLSVDYSKYFNVPSCPEFAWVMDYYGLTLFFNDQEGPFREILRAGQTSVTIPFNEYMELWDASYGTDVTEYAVNFPYGVDIFPDLGSGDLTQFAVSFGDADDEYYEVMYVDFEESGECYTFGEGHFLVFDRYPVLMHTLHGTYLYVFANVDDSTDVYVFELFDDMTVNYCGTTWTYKGSWGHESDYSSERFIYGYYTEAFTDPNCFELAEMTDVISTVSGMRDYEVDIDGMPSPLGDLLYTYDADTLTTLRDMKLIEVDHAGNIYDEFTVPAGTDVTMLRNDGESLVDFYLEDGRIGRAYVIVDWSVGYPTIDGVGIDELFGEENLSFAG